MLKYQNEHYTESFQKVTKNLILLSGLDNEIFNSELKSSKIKF